MPCYTPVATMPALTRLGILTGGGDAPGLNAVIRAVVKSRIATPASSASASKTASTDSSSRGAHDD